MPLSQLIAHAGRMVGTDKIQIDKGIHTRKLTDVLYQKAGIHWDQMCHKKCGRLVCDAVSESVESLIRLKVAFSRRNEYKEAAQTTLKVLLETLKKHAGDDSNAQGICVSAHAGLNYITRREREKIEKMQKIFSIAIVPLDIAASLIARSGAGFAANIASRALSMAEIVSYRLISGRRTGPNHLKLALLDAWQEQLQKASGGSGCISALVVVSSQLTTLFARPEEAMLELPKNLRSITKDLKIIKDKLHDIGDFANSLNNDGLLDTIVDIATLTANELGLDEEVTATIGKVRDQVLVKIPSHTDKVAEIIEKDILSHVKTADKAVDAVNKGLKAVGADGRLRKSTDADETPKEKAERLKKQKAEKLAKGKGSEEKTDDEQTGEQKSEENKTEEKPEEQKPEEQKPEEETPEDQKEDEQNSGIEDEDGQ